MSNTINLMRQAVRATPSSIQPEKAALLVIDMQHYQTREGPITAIYGMLSPSIPDYYLQRLESVVEPNIQGVVEAFRRVHATVIFSQFASVAEDQQDLAPFCIAANSKAKALVGAPLIPSIDAASAALTEAFVPADGEYILQKSRSGCFTHTALNEQLSEAGIDQLVVVGVLTHACVENTVRYAIDLGYSVFVVEDACATLDPSLHAHSIAAMEVLSAKVISAHELPSLLV